MEIRFSHDGPAFPAKLVDEFINGDVVFLCGAGVGAPQLPLFAGLLEEVYSELGVDPSPGECDAAGSGRFEEAFGSLERRLSRPAAMTEAVSKRLCPTEPQLGNHATLLRLARNLENRVCLITTNFDTLFEQALETLDGAGSGGHASYASQSLPSPGAADFSGIIHIHGRIANEGLGLEATPLVLTSAAYGDAYMRSGWASRFLFDLMRCKTLVLIGYSAGDAPVRYFLNVLDADRQRFRDIRPVYAFDGVDMHRSQSDARWSALAVTPISYQKHPRARHAALWNDLERLADLVESPKAARRARASELLALPFDAADEVAQATIKWLYQDRRDLLDVVVGSVQDPGWFEFLFAERLVAKSDLEWILPAWFANDWTSITRISIAVQWHEKLGTAFGQELNRHLRSRSDVPPLYVKAWDIIGKAVRAPREPFSVALQLVQRFRSGNFGDSDLRAAIDCIRPEVVVKDRSRLSAGVRQEVGVPTKLAQLISVEMRSRGGRDTERLRTALLAHHDHGVRLLQLSTSALRAVAYEASEVELLDEGWDRLDLDVPAVEPHQQNNHHYGLVDLVLLTSSLIDSVALSNPNEARASAEILRKIPGKVGSRLWLYGLRNPSLYTAVEVAQFLVDLPHDHFWGIRRELILLLESRARDMSGALIAKICRRIANEGPALFADLDFPGATDWRPHARDREMWLRLKAIDRVGVLPKSSRTLLRKIISQLQLTNEDYEDRDLFSTYSSGVTYVTGDAKVLINTAPEERLAQALEQQGAWDPDIQRNWSAYCTADPIAAFATLAKSRAFAKNIQLWSDLIGAIAWAPQNEDEKSKATRQRVALAVFGKLKHAGHGIISQLANRLADLWPNAPDLVWWDRIWSLLEAKDDNEKMELEDGERFYERVINRAAGRHARHLIESLDEASRKKNKALVRSLMQRALHLMESETHAGWLARGVFARHASFLLSINYHITRKALLPKLKTLDTQGKVLRATLVELGGLTQSATRAFKAPLLMAIGESRATGYAASNVAANLLRPLFLQAGLVSSDWGVTMKEARQALRMASPSIRAGAAECFKQWVVNTEMSPEDSWNKAVRSVFEEVWPQEKSYRHADCTTDLAATCIGTRTLFPDALDVIKHHLHPLNEDWAYLHFITESRAPDDFPEETLELLWIICGPGSTAQSMDLAEVLDRIKTSREQLSRQRRFQWLEQRAVRY